MPRNAAPLRASLTRPAAIDVFAAVLVCAGGLLWITLRADAGGARIWNLAACSAAALGVAVWIVRDSRWLRVALAVLSVMLLAGWVRALGAHTGDTHFAGASLGILWMALVGRHANTPARLMLAVLLFLGLAVPALLVGMAGIPTFFPPETYGPLTGDPAVLRGALATAGARDVNQNALAALVLIVAPLALATLWLRGRPLALRIALQVFGAVTFAGGVWILAVTRSDTALLAIWGLMLAILVRGAGPRWRLIAGAVIGALPLGAAVWIYRASRERAMDAMGYAHYTLLDRVDVFAYAWRVWRENFWLGIGLNDFRHVFEAAHASVRGTAHAHNVFLQTGLDIGAIGLAAYLAVLGFLFVRADCAMRGPAPVARVVAAGAAASLAAVHLFGLTDAVALGAKIGMLQWMAAGLILAASRVQASRAAGPPPPAAA